MIHKKHTFGKMKSSQNTTHTYLFGGRANGSPRRVSGQANSETLLDEDNAHKDYSDALANFLLLYGGSSVDR